MSEWQPIATAPKSIARREAYVSGEAFHEFGPYILAYPVFGEVARVRWWQSSKYGTPGHERSCNFLEDGGNAVRPTHWMPLPEPPK